MWGNDFKRSESIKNPIQMMNDFAGDLLVNNVKDHFTIDKEWEKGMDDKHTMPVDSF